MSGAMVDGPDLVLLVEDDEGLQQALVSALAREGLGVCVASDGAVALELIERMVPSLVVLDVQLPTMSGHEVCRHVREQFPALPVLMLTIENTVADRVAGLDNGADDFLGKPFDLAEFLARIRALIRRGRLASEQCHARVGEIRVDRWERAAWRGDTRLDLTAVEFRLLEALLRSPGVPIARTALLRDIWGIDFETGSRSLDVHISNLRSKTESKSRSRVIHTVRGHGFVLQL